MAFTSKKYLHDIDLDHNQLLNGVLHKSTTDLPDPVDGQLYYNTVEKQIKVFNISTVTWEPVGLDYTILANIFSEIQTISNTTNSIDPTTGAFIVSGGIGIGLNAFIGGDASIDGLLQVGGTISQSVQSALLKADTTGLIVGAIAGVDYQAAGSYVPSNRTLTINGVTYDLSNHRSWTIASGVTTVFGRGGDVVAQSGDYTTDQVNEGTRLYFTNVRSRSSLALTNTGVSGTATYDNIAGVFNIPSYTLAGLGGVPLNRILTINGTSLDLSVDRSWTINSMVYPPTGIPLSTGTSWGTSIANNSANWNTAYGWGNHASAGYVSLTGSYGNPAWITTLAWGKITDTPSFLTSYTETDPIYLASSWYSTTNNASNWNTAYSWGNHALASYVPQARTISINGISYDLSANRSWTINSMVYPTIGIAVSTGTAWGTSITDNSTNWNTAYSQTRQWDGGATGLVAATGRTSLGLVIGTNVLAYRTFGTAANNNTGDFEVPLTFSTGLSRTGNTITNTITQYTDALARLAISSSATGLSYLSGTGVFSLTSGYSIPTTSSQTNWDSAYTNRITSLTTTGSTGAATLIGNILNIPNYTSIGLPTGGTAGQILSKNSATNYDTLWIDNFAEVLSHRVKAGEAITKGQAVYVSSTNGTNMIVSKASNATESTSSKTMGLLDATVANNGFANVVTEGLLSNIDTSGATAEGDPVWLGTAGNLIYGLANKPVAPAHLVFIGIVTKKNVSTGEIFVRPQNGFELEELHNVDARSPSNADGIFYNTTTSLWEHKSIATALGYTPSSILNPTFTTSIEVNGVGVTSYTPYINTMGSFIGNVNDYQLVYVQNLNTGSNASADFVAYNDVSDVNSYFIDMGINGSNYSSGLYNIFPANAGYLYTGGGAGSQPSHLYIGTGTAASDIVLFSGGTDVSNTAVVIKSATQHVLIGSTVDDTINSLQVTGNIKSTGDITVVGAAYADSDVGSNPHQLVTKEYVDNLTATGLHVHTPVRVERHGNLTATYANGGTTPTITQITSTSILTSAGHSLLENDMIVFTVTGNGITAGETYFVFQVLSSSTFTVSATINGPAITTLTNGSGLSLTSRANSGVGATLTNAGTQAALVLSTITLVANDRVLISGQTNQWENGIYTVTNIGSVSTNWVLTRSTDANKYGSQDPNYLGGGDYFFINEGTPGASESYVLSNTAEIIFGTTAITFTKFSAAPTLSGTAPITVTGQVISLSGAVPATNGGTGTTTVTTGDLLYGSASNTWSKLLLGGAYKSLIVNGTGTQLEWNAIPLDQSVAVSGTLPVANGGIGVATLTGVAIGNGTSAITAVTGTASQLFRRNAGNTAYEFFTPTYITLTNLSATAPLSYVNTTGVFSITQATTTTDGYLSSTNWNTFNNKQATITLTVTGSSGAATFVTNTLNIPTYTLSGLGGQASSTNLTSLSGLAYVSAAFVKMTGANTFTLDTSVYYLASNPNSYTSNLGTVTSVAALTLGTTGTDITSTVATGTTTAVITLNIPTASAANRGALSSTDWSTFNSKQPTITLTTTGSSGAATFITNTLNIPTYTLAGLGGISLTSLSSTATGLTYTNTTGVFSLTSGYVIPTTTSATNWDTAYTNRITSLTVTGSSGAATLTTNTLNIPTYTLAGLGGQASSTNLTSLASLSYVSASFVKMTASGTFTLDTSTYLTSNQSITLSGAVTGTGTTAITTTLASSVVGIANLSATGTPSATTYLRGDNTWATIVSGGTGTVTSVSVTTANGISGTVANNTSTPAISLSLGIITPTSVNGLTFTAAAAGFTIAGGTTSKTLTVSNTLTLQGTDASTLSIGTGGTLGSAAYTASSAYQASNTNLTSLAGLTYASGSFVKMTGAGTFALDTTVYGVGSVTSVSVTTANGISGSVATSTSTPAITLTLGAITPTSVNSVVISGSTTPTLSVTGTTSVSGSNSGDVTLATNSGLSFTSAQTLLTLGTPSAITSSSTNSVTTTTHTHAITASLGFIGNGSAQYQVPVTGATTFTPAFTTAINLFGTSGLNALTYVSGTYFVKMTAANTFALDSTVYTANTGTVTTVSVTTANGVSGSVATAGTTPAITLTLGAITPTSVNSVVISGATTPTLAVTGTSSISGSNTGDNATNSLYSGLVTNATHTGDATGATALTVVGLRGVTLPTLGATAGLLKYTGTGTNTWVFDSSTYLTANQSITLSGAVTGSGTTAITTTLASSIVGISNLSATGTPSSTTFLRGDNTWATPAGGGGGSVSLAAVGTSPNANAATLTGSVLNLEAASASFPGVVTTGVQTFAGAKTFSPAVTASAGLGIATLFSPTLTASANGDILSAVDINPTFVPGAFTTVADWGLRVRNGGALINTSYAGDTALSITGVSGILFTVNDVLTGNLLTVNNSSFVTLFSVNANGVAYMNSGNFSAITATTTLLSVDKTLCKAMFVDYYAFNTVNSGYRAGTLMVIFDGTNVEYSEYTTKDLTATTSGMTLSAAIAGANITIVGTITSGTWTIKLGARGI